MYLAFSSELVLWQYYEFGLEVPKIVVVVMYHEQ